MREKDLKIDSFVVTCMNNIYGDDAEVNNEWYLECLNKAKDTKEFEKVSPEEKTIDEALNGGKDISADEDNDIFNLIDSMYEGDE